MDTIEKQIRDFIAKERLLTMGARSNPDYPQVEDYYLYLTDRLSGQELEKMLGHLKKSPDGQKLVITARDLLGCLGEAEKEKVPAYLLENARSGIRRKQELACPHCHNLITPFKKPVTKQKLINLLWLVAGVCFFSLSFVLKRYFVQWVVLGSLCIAKWIVDQKATKTQIMIYKALSEDSAAKSHHLHRVESHL